MLKCYAPCGIRGIRMSNTRIRKIDEKEEIQNIKHNGGRPPKTEIKNRLQYLLRNLKGGTPGIIQKEYIKSTGEKISQHTIEKYLELLADEKFLHRKVLSDNKNLVDLKEKKRRRRIILYRLRK